MALDCRWPWPIIVEMDVSRAVDKARKAALAYAGGGTGLRVEEVEQLTHIPEAWNITLSWLEEDTAAQIREQADPLRRLGLVRAPPPLERVFRVFEVRGDTPVKMKRAADP